MRIDPLSSRSAWVPNGLSGPGGTTAGRSGSSLRIDAGGYQDGFTCFWITLKVPVGVAQPSVPMPTGKVMAGPGLLGKWKRRISERFTTTLPGAAARGTIHEVGRVTIAPTVGTKASCPGLAASISLKPRSYWRAISMSESPGSTTRWQEVPMTSTALHADGVSQAADWTMGQ